MRTAGNVKVVLAFYQVINVQRDDLGKNPDSTLSYGARAFSGICFDIEVTNILTGKERTQITRVMISSVVYKISVCG